MGYACPVCEAPQRDAEHLANHLAFTAMLHGDAHEAWLDDHAPDWAESSPDDLGERVAPHAPETTYDEVFEDTVHDHGRGRPFGGDRPTRDGGDRTDASADAAPTDETTRAALAEAWELTRKMHDGRAGDGDGDATETDDGEEKA